MSSSTVVRLATRGSALALAQTALVARFLVEGEPGLTCETVEVQTRGDKDRRSALSEEGGDGLFVKEVEDALRRGEADLAVHSAKDMPFAEPDDLEILGYLPRGPVADVLVRRSGVETPRTLASGSPRRRAQAKALWPCTVWKEIRGNVETRLKKIARGEADATFLAAAGLARLGIESFPDLTFEPVPLESMVPAPGQGAIALQARRGEHAGLHERLCAATARALALEKAVLQELGEIACHIPHGACATEGQFYLFHDEHGFRSCALPRENGHDPEEEAEQLLERLQIAP